MPRNCCVVGCKSNYYKNEPTVSAFSFPKDEQRKRKWVNSIHRADFVPTSSSYVCIKHFSEGFIVREDKFPCQDGSVVTVPRKVLKLSDDAYPTIFPNQPSYMTKILAPKRTDPTERASKRINENENDFRIWLENNKIKSFEMFCDSIRKGEHNFSPFFLIEKKDYFLFVLIDDHDPESVPKYRISFKVLSTLRVNVFHGAIKIPSSQTTWILGKESVCDDWTKFDNLTSHLSSYELKKPIVSDNLALVFDILSCTDLSSLDENCLKKITFLTQQLKLVLSLRRQYEPDILLWACKIYYSYPAAYSLLRNSEVLTIPHPSYLKKILGQFGNTSSGLSPSQIMYLKEKIKLLQPTDMIVSLLLDEIYITPRLSYKGGKIEGIACNANENATTLQVFMISSLMSKYKDVVALFPIKNLNAQTLYDLTVSVLNVLSELGLNVVCLISDNNRVNRCMYEQLGNGTLQVCVNNPAPGINSPLYLMFDPVHILKNLRNNWVNQKDSCQSFIIQKASDSEAALVAKFSDLKRLHEHEKNSLVKLAPSLTQKSLYPTNLERQNVRLALRIFDEKNVIALQSFDKLGTVGTVTFLNLVIEWWKIINVKHPLKGRNKRDEFCDPIRSSDDSLLRFLLDVNVFLEKWHDVRNYGQGKLTQQTFTALVHTNNAIVQICKFLFDKFSCKYILLGKLQTDNLEARFGQYRQMSGGNYNISINEVLESERKLKILSLMKRSNIALKNVNFKSECENGMSDPELIEKFEYVVDESYFIEVEDDGILSVIVYIAGYAANSALKRLSDKSCLNCKGYFVVDKILEVDYACNDEYLASINRGGLKWPTQFVVDIVTEGYKILQCLISPSHEQDFLKVSYQKKLLYDLILHKFCYSLLLESCIVCDSSFKEVISSVITVVCNILLNNYCKIKNDVKPSTSKKRKINTFNHK